MIRQSEFAALQHKTILTVLELSKYTGYSTKYIYKLVHKRKIRFYKPRGGRRLFFLMTDVEAWLLHNRCLTVEEILEEYSPLKLDIK